MAKLVSIASARHGTPGAGRCYCLKLPAVIGGGYVIDNIGTISIDELIRFSGNIAQQIEHLPDGSNIKIKITK
jgi:hypothetical protein